MEAKSFVKLLRKVIREEVRSAVKEILVEQKTNHNQVIDHGIRLAEIANKPNSHISIAKKKKTFTKNSILNDLLNETSETANFGNMQEGPLVMQGSWPQMGPSRTSTMVQSAQPLATTDINGKPVNMQNEQVAKTVGLITKDYSALMNAIDKKKGIKK